MPNDTPIKETEVSLKLKEAEEILNDQIQASLKEYSRSRFSLFISSFAAGLEIGFSVLLMCIFFTLFHNHYPSYTLQLLLALAYPIGFIFVVIGRSELFTEHTALAVLPVFNKTVSVVSLAKLWFIILLGNLVGGYLFSLIITSIGPAMEIIQPLAFEHLANKMTQQDWWIILGSGILAGWLMGLLEWMVTSSQETIGQIVIIILITFVIGIGNMHHSIVGSIEVFSGFLVSKEISMGDYLHFQGLATIGNVVGGVVFVAVVKYSHIKPEKN